MCNEIELFFHELPFIRGSIAIDFHPWTFFVGLGRYSHVVSSQGRLWREWTLWLGPLAVTLTFYGGVK